MKILYIHQHFSTPAGSTGTRSYELTKRLIEAGHDVTMLCASNERTQSGLTSRYKQGIRHGDVEKIKVTEIDLEYSNHDSFIKRTFKFLQFSLKTIKIVKNTPYDLLFATSTPLTVAIPGIIMKILRLKKSKLFIFEVRDLWPELPKAMGVIRNPAILKLLTVLEKNAYKAADFGVALSPGIAEGMAKYGTLKPAEISLIPNGCDIDFFKNIRIKTDNKILSNLLEDASKKTVVFTGAHGMANGLDAVLNAAKILADEHRNDIQFVFIGDGKMKPGLQQTAKELALKNCHFFDSVPKEQMPYILNKATAGLMVLANIKAFYYGTSPNKFFDYLAAGLPIINNYPGWVADLIKAHNCGITCLPDDPQAFANAIISIADLSSPEQKKMSDQAKELAKQFDRDMLAHQFISLCETAFEKNKNSAKSDINKPLQRQNYHV